MSSLRPLTTYFLLTAMLLSNAVGWLHVGCCTPSEHHVEVANGAASNALCCHHRCEDSVETDSDLATDEPEHAPEHDSDSCSFCQSFFASRDAILTFVDCVALVPAPTSRLLLDRDEDATDFLFLNGLSVRGPPVV